MKKIRILTFMTVVLFATVNACNTEKKVQAIDPTDMDLSVSPADDFDNYANGGWKVKHPLPADKSRFGSFDLLRDEAEKQLQTLFDKVTSEEHEQGSNGQKIADLYKIGMDTVAIEQQGIGPLQPYLNEIASCETSADVQQLITKLHYAGTGTLFSFFGSADKHNSDWVIAQLYQGGLGLSDKDYYLNEDESSVEIREEYISHVAKMFELIGESEAVASENAQKVMDLETRLAKASLSRLERRDPHRTYNKMNLHSLVELSPDYD
jgi:putative endopeptidase